VSLVSLDFIDKRTTDTMNITVNEPARLSEACAVIRPKLPAYGVDPNHPFLHNFSRKLRGLCADGVIPHIRYNNQFRFEPEHIDAAVKVLASRLRG
jgi:hypothetical protein